MSQEPDFGQSLSLYKKAGGGGRLVRAKTPLERSRSEDLNLSNHGSVPQSHAEPRPKFYPIQARVESSADGTRSPRGEIPQEFLHFDRERQQLVGMKVAQFSELLLIIAYVPPNISLSMRLLYHSRQRIVFKEVQSTKTSSIN